MIDPVLPDAWITRHRIDVDRALSTFLERELNAMRSEVARAPLEHAVLASGKRIRPLLLLASREAAAGAQDLAPEVVEALATLACSVELVHAYSLIHDDLPCMDDDTLRRGQPTAHVVFGVPVAVLAGAALMPLAMRAILSAAAPLDLNDDTAAQLVGVLARASGGAGMVGGQWLDLMAEGRDVGLAELERIHLGKTARLIEAACVMGAIAGRAEPDTVQRLAAFGRALGLAFQVVDDILDVTGSTRELGKAGGRDQALGKATMPSVLGLEGANRLGVGLTREAEAAIDPLSGSDALRSLARLVVERKR